MSMNELSPITNTGSTAPARQVEVKKQNDWIISF